MVLYVYHTTFNVTIGRTLFQLVYGLCPLMLIKYLLTMSNSHLDWDFSPNHIFISCMAKLEHSDDTHQEVANQIGTR
jgi:hypothetical protein